MFGGLHIEMTALKSIGMLLKDSGWTTALASPGTALQRDRFRRGTLPDDCGTLLKD